MRQLRSEQRQQTPSQQSEDSVSTTALNSVSWTLGQSQTRDYQRLTPGSLPPPSTHPAQTHGPPFGLSTLRAST